MIKPYLSICIPTYNRANYLKNTLESIVSSNIFQTTHLIEIVISDNVSSDNTGEIVTDFKNIYPDKINYIRLKNPIDSHLNFENALKNGKGTYLKLLNDHTVFTSDGLTEFIKDLKRQDGISIFLTFIIKRHSESGRIISNCNDMLDYASFYLSWISAFCFKKEIFQRIQNPFRYYYLNFPHIDMLFRLLESGNTAYVSNKKYLVSQKVLYTNRNEAIIFGKSYLTLLEEYKEKAEITDSVYQKEKRAVLFWYILPIYFDFYHQYNKTKTLGYRVFWQSMEKYHQNFYFYLSFPIAVIYAAFTKLPLLRPFISYVKNIFIRIILRNKYQ